MFPKERKKNTTKERGNKIGEVKHNKESEGYRNRAVG